MWVDVRITLPVCFTKQKLNYQSWLSERSSISYLVFVLVVSFITHVLACVSEAEADSESTMHYVIGAILYRTLGLILPAPK